MTDIPGYQGLYAITPKGEIWSYRRKRYLKPVVHKSGYVYVGLYDWPKRFNARLHRLLAQTYIPNPNNYREINHIDGNKSNNKLENLEWCDRSQNLLHMYKTRTVMCPNCGYNKVPVKAI